MGCKGSRDTGGSKTGAEDPPEAQDHNKTSVGCLQFDDPALFSPIEAQFASGRPDMGSDPFTSTGEESERYQGQLNARLAAMILQKRANRQRTRGRADRSVSHHGRSSAQNGSRTSSPSSSQSSSRACSRRNSTNGEMVMMNLQHADDLPSPGLGSGSRSRSTTMDTATPRTARSTPRTSVRLRAKSTSGRRIKWDKVEINEFARDFNCAGAQPSSGGLPLGMGMYHVSNYRVTVDEYENSRKNTRVPSDRFHILGRLSPMERGKLFDVRQNKR
eukprot:TRINITY_DN17631_c0_g1_i2.p1 TRINITY_DN17631_c0_g1~~TRINITY_DN17631_c0_g1_i2.p1  ORF type:complete len:274 (+),score=44.34 TRINITY_DN17631_c0_g1_i2:317-1138(+)